MTYFTVSAKTGDNIQETFSTILAHLVRKHSEKGPTDQGNPREAGQELESLPTEAKLESGTAKGEPGKERESGCAC